MTNYLLATAIFPNLKASHPSKLILSLQSSPALNNTTTGKRMFYHYRFSLLSNSLYAQKIQLFTWSFDTHSFGQRQIRKIRWHIANKLFLTASALRQVLCFMLQFNSFILLTCPRRWPFPNKLEHLMRTLLCCNCQILGKGKL